MAGPGGSRPALGRQRVRLACGRFANWLLLAYHLVCRGESLRAVDALAHARRHLLWMARLGRRHGVAPPARFLAELSLALGPPHLRHGI